MSSPGFSITIFNKHLVGDAERVSSPTASALFYAIPQSGDDSCG